MFTWKVFIEVCAFDVIACNVLISHCNCAVLVCNFALCFSFHSATKYTVVCVQGLLSSATEKVMFGAIRFIITRKRVCIFSSVGILSSGM